MYIVFKHSEAYQGRNKVAITRGARYLCIFPTSEDYIVLIYHIWKKTGGAMAPPAPPVPTALHIEANF